MDRSRVIARKLWGTKLLVVLWLSVNILDMACTQAMLANGWMEFNPILSNLSISGMWTYKMLGTALVGILLISFNKRSWLGLAALGVALAAVWNAVNLAFIL